ncbi:MAG TPA: hypothetical protein VGL71_04085 [Urbifossiella sp.]|jgi:hypothetical protein
MSEQINVKGTITMGEPERRDLFAAAALSGLLAGNRNVGDNSVEALAKLSFQIADVMLSASAEGAANRESNT